MTLMAKIQNYKTMRCSTSEQYQYLKKIYMLELCENNSLSKYIPKCTEIALYFMFPYREHAQKRVTT